MLATPLCENAFFLNKYLNTYIEYFQCHKCVNCISGNFEENLKTILLYPKKFNNTSSVFPKSHYGINNLSLRTTGFMKHMRVKVMIVLTTKFEKPKTFDY